MLPVPPFKNNDALYTTLMSVVAICRSAALQVNVRVFDVAGVKQ